MAKLTLATGAAAPFDSLDYNTSSFGLALGTRAWDQNGDTYRFCLMDTAQPSPNLFHNSDSKQANVLEEKQQAEFQSVRPKCLRCPPCHICLR